MQTNSDILNVKVMSNPLSAAKSRGVQNDLQLGCQKFLLH